MSDLRSKENCGGRFPALWRFTYSMEALDQFDARMKTMEGQYDVIALNQGFAIEAFKLDRPAHIYALRTGPDFICYVDADFT